MSAEKSRLQRAVPWLVGALVCAAVAVQARLLGIHWINPDEGAHVMDAVLTMDGLIPSVDFSSRRPFYVFSYVPFLHFFGGGYVAARVMPVLATLLAGGVLYLIGRRLWGRTVGTVAALAYLFSPTIFVNASVVKTEPLAILMTSLGVYGLVAHLQGRRWWPLFLGGAALGLGYYVRESALAGLLACTVIILVHRREGIWRRLGTLYAGFGMVCAAVIGAYAQHAQPHQLAETGLIPFLQIARSLSHIAAWFQPQTSGAGAAAVGAAEAVRQSAQSWSWTVKNLTEPMLLNLPLILGVVIVALLWAAGRVTRSHGRTAHAPLSGTSVAFAWLGSFVLLYGYYALHRGFFQFYFREFIPPMALLLAVALVWLRSAWRRTAGIAAIVSLAASGAVAVSVGARVLDTAYDCVWSPETIRSVSRIVREHTAPDDEVLSGAVIWELEAGRRPFLNISHPLGFIDGMSNRTARRIDERLAERPPRIIVLDGYTERTYLMRVAELEPLIETSYRQIHEEGDSRYPVRVLALKEAR